MMQVLREHSQPSDKLLGGEEKEKLEF